MKKIGIIILLIVNIIVIPESGIAQNTSVDSLKRLINDQPHDSVKLKANLELSSQVFRFQPDSAIVYASEAKRLAEELEKNEDLGYALKNIGLAYYVKGDFKEVLEYWEESLAIFQSIDNSLGISNLLNNLGAVYYSKGDDPRALENYLESLKIATKLEDKSRIATAHANIGLVYFNNNATHVQAKESYLKALTLAEEINEPDAIGSAANGLGELYLESNDYKDAIFYFEKAFKAFEKTGGSTSTALNYIGETHAKQGNYPLAIEYHQRAFNDAESKKSKIEMMQALIGLAEGFHLQKNYITAKETYNKAEVLAKEIGAKSELQKIYEGLSLSYSETGNYQQAYEFQSKFVEIKDTLRNQETDERIGNLRLQFDLDNKDIEIELLNLDNDVKEAKIKQNNIFRNFLYALAGFLLIIIGGVYYQYRFAKNSNQLLEYERNQSEEILLNILPKDTAEELKKTGSVEARKFFHTTVLFTDFTSFTIYAEKVTPEDLVKSLDYFFKKFDQIIQKHNLEKIKTIGDSYMAAGGLPTPNTTNPFDAVNAAREIVDFVKNVQQNPPNGIQPFAIRVGINTGPVVAGVVGTKKFQYDIWGSAVNIASRMESNCIPGKINISHNTYQLVKEKFNCTYQGEIDVKQTSDMKMYSVDGIKEKIS